MNNNQDGRQNGHPFFTVQGIIRGPLSDSDCSSVIYINRFTPSVYFVGQRQTVNTRHLTRVSVVFILKFDCK